MSSKTRFNAKALNRLKVEMKLNTSLIFLGSSTGQEAILYEIVVDDSQFDRNQPIYVNLTEKNGKLLPLQELCVTLADAKTQTQYDECHKQLEQMKKKQQNYVFTIHEHGHTLKFYSEELSEGESYLIRVEGKAKDQCNTLFAENEGVVNKNNEPLVFEEFNMTLDCKYIEKYIKNEEQSINESIIEKNLNCLQQLVKKIDAFRVSQGTSFC